MFAFVFQISQRTAPRSLYTVHFSRKLTFEKFSLLAAPAAADTTAIHPLPHISTSTHTHTHKHIHANTHTHRGHERRRSRACGAAAKRARVYAEESNAGSHNQPRPISLQQSHFHTPCLHAQGFPSQNFSNVSAIAINKQISAIAINKQISAIAINKQISLEQSNDHAITLQFSTP